MLRGVLWRFGFGGPESPSFREPVKAFDDAVATGIFEIK